MKNITQLVAQNSFSYIQIPTSRVTRFTSTPALTCYYT